MSGTISRFPRRAVLLAAAALAAILLLGFWVGGRPQPPQYLSAPVRRGSLTSAVEATGTINPLTTAPVGSYVSGTVKLVFADFNTRVRAGQVLAQIDPAVYEAQVATARGNLASAQTLQVLVDGSVVSTFNNITGTFYTNLTTATFSAAAGNHTITFLGTNLNGGDNTAFIDQVAITSV
jgi:multidrug efflux pump subunit AcrA (membrane-fusion protein)